MAEQVGFFNEDANTKSMMRLMSFLVLIFFFIMNGLILVSHIKSLAKGDCTLPQIDQNFLWFDSLLLIAAFCPKVLQKLIETKFGVKDDLPTDKPVTNG